MAPELPIPPHFDPNGVDKVRRVPYQDIADAASKWGADRGVSPAAEDGRRVCLVLVDVQNTFCIPDFELYVGGASGQGAVDDNRRLCQFLYRNLHNITQIVATLDTHQAMQIFHGIFLIDENGEQPAPYTLITVEDVVEGRWSFNPTVGIHLNISPEDGQRHLEHYVQELRKSGKYELTVWPYHAMLGGVGHAMVSAVEEAVFFHTMARCSQPDWHVKGNHPMTEHYSIIGAEVATGPDGDELTEKSDKLMSIILDYDAIIFAGQAKSHCVAWTVADLLENIQAVDDKLANKIYLLEDCTSPVVVPGLIDYTDDADAAFEHFAEAGMHVVQSTDPMDSWPGIRGT